MTRLRSLAVTLRAAIFLIAAAFAPAVTFASDVLTLATPGKLYTADDQAIREWAYAISDLSNKELVPSVQVVAPGTYKELLRAVRQGTLKGAIVPLDLIADELNDPFYRYSDVPGLSLSYAAARRVDGIMKPQLVERGKGIVPIFTVPLSPWGIFSREPLKSLHDLAGKRLATLDGRAKWFADYFHAILVSESWEGLRSSVERHSADVLLPPPLIANYLKRSDLEGFKYFYPVKVFIPRRVAIINFKYLRSLDAKERSYINIPAYYVERDAWKDTQARASAAMRLLKEYGIGVEENIQMEDDAHQLAQSLLENTFPAIRHVLDHSKYADPPSRGCRFIPVFFATDRSQNSVSAGMPLFGYSLSTKNTYGRVDVAMPWPRTANIPGGNQCASKPSQDSFIAHVTKLPERKFVADVKTAYAQAKAAGNAEGPVLYIHGFANTFAEAALTTADLSEKLDKKSPVGLLFSWPSEGHVLSYIGDEERVEKALQPLSNAMTQIEKGVGKIDVVAHSMGNRALLGALAKLSPMELRGVEDIGFFAPDASDQLFDQARASLRKIGGVSSVYASDNDAALLVSSLKHVGEPRVGLLPLIGAPMDVSPADLIDVSEENSSLLGHSYDVIEPVVADDMRLLFHKNERASQRHLYPKYRSGRLVYVFRE